MKKEVSQYKYVYLEKEADVAAEKIMKTDRKQGEKLFAAVAMKILGKLEDGIISEKEASKLFARFIGFHDYFPHELNEAVRAGCLMPLSKRPHSTQETIEKMRHVLKSYS